MTARYIPVSYTHLDVYKRQVTKHGGKNYYVISAKALYEKTGVKIDGYEPPPSLTVNIDYEKLAEEVAKTLVCGMAKIFGKEGKQ